MKSSVWIPVLIATLCPAFVAAQEREDRALYSWQQMRGMISMKRPVNAPCCTRRNWRRFLTPEPAKSTKSDSGRAM